MPPGGGRPVSRQQLRLRHPARGRALGADAYFVWHRDADLRGADVVILPGGFSYGDYLRSGAIARFSPVMQAVQRHAADGGPVLGICNGFQILCEAHLLPGALLRNAGLTFVSKPVDVTVEQIDTAFTCDYEPGAGCGCQWRTAKAASWPRRTRCACSRRRAGSCCAMWLPPSARRSNQTRTGPPTTSPASAMPPGTLSGIMPHPGAGGRSAAGDDRRQWILQLHDQLSYRQRARRRYRLMKPDKPSRNEDEYFAREDAELLRKQRDRAHAASAEAERKTPLS